MEENKEKVENKEESVKEAEVVTNNETIQEKKSKFHMHLQVLYVH